MDADCAQPKGESSARHHWCNIGLAVFLVGLLLVTWFGASGGMWDSAALVVATAVLVVNTVRRPPALAADHRLWVCLVCIVSLLYFLAFDDNPARPGGQHGVAYWTVVLCHIAGDVCLITLGKSFAILPARRGIRTRFLYRFVRHPVYALYMVADACFVLFAASIWNIAVLGVGLATFVIRAKLEERLLDQDKTYQRYKKNTPYRFFPGVY